MPCSDGGWPHAEERPTKDELKAMLCDFCTFAVAFGHMPPSTWPEHIRLWWEQHQIEDTERKRREAASREAYKAHLRKVRAEIDAELAEE